MNLRSKESLRDPIRRKRVEPCAEYSVGLWRSREGTSGTSAGPPIVDTPAAIGRMAARRLVKKT
jgi:hypothetical protein